MIAFFMFIVFVLALSGVGIGNLEDVKQGWLIALMLMSLFLSLFGGNHVHTK